MLRKNLVFEVSRLYNVNEEEVYAELTIYHDGEEVHVEPNFDGAYIDIALEATVQALSNLTEQPFEVSYEEDYFEIQSGATSIHIGDSVDTKSAIRYLVSLFGFDSTFITVRHAEDGWDE